MKKLLIAAIVLLGITFSAQAQTSAKKKKSTQTHKSSHAKGVSENALGLRFGSNNGFGTEISYQRLLSSKNRLELDLGLYNHSNYNKHGYNDYSAHSAQLTGIYQWLWNIDGGFNWYAGVGATVGTYNESYYNNGYPNGYSYNEFNLGVVGDIGIEYDFKEAPIQLSLDYRPGIILTGDYNNGFNNNIALGIRFRF